MNKNYEVIIIGGGASGLSAALAFGRMGINALVIDSGKPRNEPSEHLNNFTTRDGINPKKWVKIATDQLQKYSTVDVVKGLVVGIVKKNNAFKLELLNSPDLYAPKILLATGVKDILPAIEGVQELWGKHIFHCPFCHGHEVKGLKIALMADEKMAKHSLPMLYGLSKEISLFSNGETIQDRDFLAALKSKNISTNTEQVKRISFKDDKLIIETLSKTYQSDCMFMPPKIPFTQSAPLFKQLGCETDELGFIKTDEFGRTSVEGVFAAGDNMAGMHSVLAACYRGSLAAAIMTGEIRQHDFFIGSLAETKV